MNSWKKEKVKREYNELSSSYSKAGNYKNNSLQFTNLKGAQAYLLFIFIGSINLYVLLTGSCRKRPDGFGLFRFVEGKMKEELFLTLNMSWSEHMGRKRTQIYLKALFIANYNGLTLGQYSSVTCVLIHYYVLILLYLSQ